MPLTKEATYSQDRYKFGVCLRLSFKWAALSLAGGPFNLAEDTAGLNVDSTQRKQTNYTTVFEQALTAQGLDLSRDFTDTQKFAQMVELDASSALEYINRWGLKFRGAKSGSTKGTEYNGVSVTQRLDQTLTKYFTSTENAAAKSLVYVYWGRNAKGPDGHAVAFSNGKFFDSNSGVWTCNPSESAGTDIDDHLIQEYTSEFNLEKFTIFVLAHQPSSGFNTNIGGGKTT